MPRPSLRLSIALLSPLVAAPAMAGDGATRTLGGLIGSALAQQALKRTPLQRLEYPGDKHVVVTALVEAAPNATIPRHTHPGVETGYVLEGEAVLAVDGQPEVTLKPGGTYSVPVGVPHGGRVGGAPFKFVAIYAVEKDKPLASPAP